MKVVVQWTVVLVNVCSWKGVRLVPLPLLPGLWSIFVGDMLSGVAASCSRTACHYLRCTRLVTSVGPLIDFLMLLGTLGIGVCVSKERVILLLSSLWDVGMLVGVCTLGTCCMLGVVGGVVVSLKRSGCACMWACVASMIS